MIRRLDRLVSLPATDVARAVRFYSETLGLQTVVADEGSGFYIFALPEGENLVGVHRHPGHLRAPEEAGIWFWLTVDSIDATREALEAKGVTFLGGRQPLGPGWEQAFADSEGNVLRLYEMLNRVERSVEILAPPETLWAALTDAPAIARWFAPITSIELEGRQGGRVAFVDPVFGPVRGCITEWQPGRYLAIEFSENWPRHLEYRLNPIPGGTRLTVLQTDFEPIRDRDFGIPGMIEHLDQALALLATLVKAGGMALGAVEMAKSVREGMKRGG